MEIIGCANGHFYNPELYSSCPECARKNSGGSDFHGDRKPDISLGTGHGNLEIPYSVLDGLRERHAAIYK